ncbi:mycothiol transferase [Arthrobacter sp. H14]|uniref:mycothiol transferase n=1 Tax=Arthrobacter sp. H14 TaxID=1312959 RepID=UPI00047904F7|nr:DUF664 domain-containing protein [Arthrobacter sp. H14]
MNSNDVLLEGFYRIPDLVRSVVNGLDSEALGSRPNRTGNSIAWLIWHLSRVEDDHIADAAGTDQLWTTAGWSEKFDLPLGTGETGYGHSSEQVSSVQVDSAELLVDYYNAVHARTVKYVRGLSDQDLDQVVDDSWDPPVTLGVRLVSVTQDCLQHAGQAAYVRGLLRNQ